MDAPLVLSSRIDPEEIDDESHNLDIFERFPVEFYEETYTPHKPADVLEYIDNVEVRSYIATLGETRAFDVTGKTWAKLANGNHTLKIVATDGFSDTIGHYTFTKSVNILAVQRATPIESSVKPTNIVVSVVRNVPYNAKMKVEVCNNGFDTKPTWETIVEGVASELPSGLTHVFANTTKKAGQWGVNIRVTVDRNGSEGACYITEIGGNFE